MKKLLRSKAFAIIILVILMIIAAIATAYAAVFAGDLPIKLPFHQVEVIDTSIPDNTVGVMQQWTDRVIYQPKHDAETVQDILDSENIKTEEVSKSEMLEGFDYIDKMTFEDYCLKNSNEVKEDVSKLLIDKADKKGTVTGIKTIHGDDVLALDVMDGISIIGIKIDKKSYDAKAKLAIVNDKRQIGMSYVKNMSFWEQIKGHAKSEDALIAINASNYIWNDSANYATLFGGASYKGEVIKKATYKKNIIGISKKGTITYGANLYKAYNAFESMDILIKDGKTVYTSKNNDRSAFTAIGTTKDGKTLLLVVEGGAYGSKIGGTYKDAVKIMKTYGAENAAVVSGGTRTAMYWNGRIITEHAGYSKDGVKLPNAIIVRPAVSVDDNKNVTIEDEKSSKNDKQSEDKNSESIENNNDTGKTDDTSETKQ